jgi:hypothetical protein
MAARLEYRLKRDLEHRPLALARLGFGLALLAAPRALCSRIGPVDRPTVVVARILGMRHVAEALVLAPSDSRATAIGGVAVDSIHAVTAVAVAGASPPHRRLALANAATAVAFVIGGAVQVAHTG